MDISRAPVASGFKTSSPFFMCVSGRLTWHFCCSWGEMGLDLTLLCLETLPVMGQKGFVPIAQGIDRYGALEWKWAATDGERTNFVMLASIETGPEVYELEVWAAASSSEQSTRCRQRCWEAVPRTVIEDRLMREIADELIRAADAARALSLDKMTAKRPEFRRPAGFLNW